MKVPVRYIFESESRRWFEFQTPRTTYIIQRADAWRLPASVSAKIHRHDVKSRDVPVQAFELELSEDEVEGVRLAEEAADRHAAGLKR